MHLRLLRRRVSPLGVKLRSTSKMKCKVCDHTHLDLAIDLGNQPVALHFLKKEQVGKEPYYPLRVVHCPKCFTAQLDYTVPKEEMYSDHTYLSGMTKTQIGRASCRER